MRKTTVRFFTIADYEEEEIWLREQHRSGWKLVRLTPPCIYEFESCAPQDVIYRMDFKNNAEAPDYMQMISDFGWEYFTRSLGWLYFRKPADQVEAEEEGELFSDPESKVDMAGRIVRTRLVPIMIILWCCVLPNLVNAINGRMGVHSGILGGFFTVMFAFYVYLIVYCGIKLKRIREKYQG